jgi:hypothetical protein
MERKGNKEQIKSKKAKQINETNKRNKKDSKVTIHIFDNCRYALNCFAKKSK